MTKFTPLENLWKSQTDTAFVTTCCMYLPTQKHEQDATQGQFLIGVQQVWI